MRVNPEVERWLKENTFRCALGRVSPETCERLRARPLYGTTPRPFACRTCRSWKRKIAQVEKRRARKGQGAPTRARKTG